MPNTDETIVIFRVWKSGYGKGDVIALFPGLNYTSGDCNYGMCMSYMHVGQHSEADYVHCVRMTRPAKPEEYAELEKELESLGYKLVVKRRW
jgi:hypothetical protein